MRTMKFRAIELRDPSKMHWVYGAFIKHLPYTPYPDEQITEDKYQYAIVTDGFSDWNMPRNLDVYPVNPKTVGEFTGLYDCKKHEIFEGDILRVVVPDDDEKFMVPVRYMTEDDYPAFDLDPRYVPKNWITESNLLAEILSTGFGSLEVVGNVFQNPELLKQGDESSD